MATDVVRFAGFALNKETGELRRDGSPVPLERQPAQVLVVLVERAGQLVTRRELQGAIWGDGTHVDFDRGLNYCLRQIRIALGDDAKAPRFIQTLPRQGYRFVADVSTSPPAPLKAPPLSRRGVAIAAAVVVAAALLEAGPRNDVHHQVAVDLARYIHDVFF